MSNAPSPHPRDLLGPTRPTWRELPGHRAGTTRPSKLPRRAWLALAVLTLLVVVAATVLGALFADRVVAVPDPDEPPLAAAAADAGLGADQVEEVTLPGITGLAAATEAGLPDGPATLPAWWVRAGDGTRAVLHVHGRGGTRADGLGVAAIAADAGWSTLVTTHRGDGIAADPVDGVAGLGSREWPDVEAAVRWLERRGVEEVVLAGTSQGAMVVVNWWTRVGRGEHGGLVTGAFFDSALVSLTGTLRQQALDRGIPGPLTRPVLFGTKAWASLRYGLDASAAEVLWDAATWELPTVLVHGDDDTQVPLANAREFAEDAPAAELAVFDAGHVGARDADPVRYRALFTDLLQDRPMTSD